VSPPERVGAERGGRTIRRVFFGSGPVETIAVYQETIIRTYGFRLIEGLSMLRMRICNNRWASIEPFLAEAGGHDPGFHAVFSQWAGADALEVFLLVEARKERHIQAWMETALYATWVETLNPVDLISFQGPHFGDRYGIAQAVYQAFHDGSIPLLASEFSQSAVFLVLPGGSAQSAERCLTGVFEVPPHPRVASP